MLGHAYDFLHKIQPVIFCLGTHKFFFVLLKIRMSNTIRFSSNNMEKTWWVLDMLYLLFPIEI